MSVALITGPTTGIGRSFAHRLASDGFDLVLVSRNEHQLNDLAGELRKTIGVNAEVIVADLSRRSDLDEVAARLADRERPVELLVNNAGFSLNERFLGGRVDQEQRLLDVLVVAVMRLTHAALPGMVERAAGAVINVSSVAGFLPFGTYAAAKAWVTSFSQGLANELDGTGVSAMALCPGLVHTEFHERAGLDMSGTRDWMWLAADDVVATALADLQSGKVLSIPGVQYKTMSVAARLLPRDGLRRVERLRRHLIRPRSVS